ncbi:serine/threonine-protein kinase PDIK1L-like [Branchiostoma lanceolatum]|uniref:serine/threonine-protein kinase PDIK1L-like n=1 Tax=Branchiostoma lanceolatum TaxID=7740 RepID=UPI0034521B46
MQYKVGSMLGKGAFGEVYRAKDTMGRTFALKILTLQDDTEVRAANRELKPLLQLAQRPHEHILPFLHHCYENNKLHLVLEYCEQGTLNDLLLRQSWDDKVELRLMAEIADGVSFLHDNNIVHRDLKPDNILISGSEQTPVVKVGDFGLAKICGQGEESFVLSADNYYMLTYNGTKFFMPPEILLHNPYTCRCDVFSMGVIFVSMFVRTKIPSRSSESKPKVVAFVRGRYDVVPIGIAQNQTENFSLKEEILRGLDEHPFKDLCLLMLSKDHHVRPPARDVLDKIRSIQHLVPQNGTQNSPIHYMAQDPQITYRCRPQPMPSPVSNRTRPSPGSNRPRPSPGSNRPRPSQATVRKPQPVIVVGAVCVGAIAGFSCGGAMGAVGGAILGLGFGYFFG